MEKKLPLRKDVPVEETWDLTLMYESEEAVREEIRKAKAMAEKLREQFEGKLHHAAVIVDCLSAYQKLYEILHVLGNYGELCSSTDYYDDAMLDLTDEIGRVIAQISSSLSFIESEISEAEESELEKALVLVTDTRGYLKEIIRKKPHTLHSEAERVLKAVSPTLDTPYDIYNASKLADMKFDSFTAGGVSYPLGYSLFEDNYEYEPDTAIRRASFDAFHQKLREYENTTAASYNAYVQNEKIISRLRGFSDIFEKDLFYDHVPRPLYDRQIDLIMEKLAPSMRRLARLIQKVHGLDRMTYADLKLPLDPDFCPPVSIAESRRYIEEGLSILGADYKNMINEAYGKRWIDFACNQGKSTGGFCCSPYGKPSFILLSFQGKMSDVFTLAHELGHAGHFMLANAAQPVLDTEVACYFVECPSTMNELIMANYMQKTSPDKRFRRWVLANVVQNTYYHNFVTHLLEAAFQREAYRIVDGEGSLQAKTLNRIMREVLEKFWGDAVELNEGAELTWMRQPHYYMGLYSYTYSAGLTIATEMEKRIEREGQPAVEDWKKVLAAGSTVDPVEFAARLGIDITTDQPLLDTIDTISGYIDEIIHLTEELTM